ncbi:MAG TPA: heme o synthase [Gaiellales bacterium]|jgi:protoheme IX farnesyltransferase
MQRPLLDSGVRPGPWLRLTAVGASAATALVVVSGALHMTGAHRALALAALAPMVAMALAARFAHPQLLRFWGVALGLLLAEIALGGVVALEAPSPALHWLHVGVACLALAAAVAGTAATLRGEPVPAAPWRDYVTLTKPRVMSLLLWTGACGMFVGARGVPPAGRFAVAIAGLALACGGASALNHLLDRDIDQEMKRTAGRPVASGRVAAPRALEFGLALSACSFVLLATLVNPLTAALALAGNLFYVIVYTRWLKRSTAQNIVIGGAAGAVPPLVGWAAATGHLSIGAAVLFVIVFVWTPPHFWALALLIKKDYAAAGVPMLPVVRGDAAAARQILLYSLGLVALTALPVVVGIAGWPYLVVAAASGLWFIWLAWRLLRDPVPKRAGALFHYSMLYLAVLFVAMAANAV